MLLGGGASAPHLGPPLASDGKVCTSHRAPRSGGSWGLQYGTRHSALPPQLSDGFPAEPDALARTAFWRGVGKGWFCSPEGLALPPPPAGLLRTYCGLTEHTRRGGGLGSTALIPWILLMFSIHQK